MGTLEMIITFLVCKDIFLIFDETLWFFFGQEQITEA